MGVIALIILMQGCTDRTTPATETFLVGIMVADESPSFNEALSLNTKLALAEFTDNGIIPGKNTTIRVQFITIPVPNTPLAARQCLFEAVHTYGVHAIIGGGRSQTAVKMARASEELGLPFLTTAATSATMNNGKLHTFNTSPSTGIQAADYASFLHNHLGALNIALLVEENSMFASDFSEALRYAHLDSTGQLSSLYYYSQNDNLSSKLNEMVADNPDVIVHCGFQPHSFVVGKALESLGYDKPLLSMHNGQAFSYLHDLPQTNLPLFSLSYWAPDFDSTINRNYCKNFYQMTGRTPTEDDVMVYDTTLRLLEAVKKTDAASSIALQYALASQAGMVGAAGMYSFIPETTLGSQWSLAILDGRLVIDEIDRPGSPDTGKQPGAVWQ